MGNSKFSYSMTKKYLYVILFFAFSFQVKAEYSAKKIYEMIIQADKIVLGKIISQDSKTFTFRIKESPTTDSGDITIQKFTDWTCAARWNDYKINQELLIFIFKRKGKYYAMSGGNEGELPIRNDSVFINGFSVPPPPPEDLKKRKRPFYIDSKHYKIDSKKYFGFAMSKADMLESIEFIRACFKYDIGKYYRPTNWTISCKENTISEMATKHKIVEWTYMIAKHKNSD